VAAYPLPELAMALARPPQPAPPGDEVDIAAWQGQMETLMQQVSGDAAAGVADWDSGAFVDVVDDIVIVRQTLRGHQKVAAFLESLRRRLLALPAAAPPSAPEGDSKTGIESRLKN
jgi:hypothetical protein